MTPGPQRPRARPTTLSAPAAKRRGRDDWDFDEPLQGFDFLTADASGKFMAGPGDSLAGGGLRDARTEALLADLRLLATDDSLSSFDEGAFDPSIPVESYFLGNGNGNGSGKGNGAGRAAAAPLASSSQDADNPYTSQVWQWAAGLYAAAMVPRL